jgi:hypothetical protein
MSPEQRTGQRYKLQNSSKILLKEKRRKSKRKSSGLLAGGLEELISLFKDQFISCKAGKIWAVPRKELVWLSDLINIVL